MTTVVTLANMPSSAADVAVKFLDQTKLVLRESGKSADGSSFAEYVYADGDPTTETLVTWRIAYNAKTGVNRISCRLQTVQVVAVDSVETERAPIVQQWTIEAPGIMEDTAAIMSMVGTTYGLLFDGVTTKVPNLGIIDSVNRGLLKDLY